MNDLECPICGVVLGSSGLCASCGRTWYEVDGALRSKTRRVKLVKLPEPGDDLNEIIVPVEEKR